MDRRLRAFRSQEARDALFGQSVESSEDIVGSRWTRLFTASDNAAGKAREQSRIVRQASRNRKRERVGQPPSVGFTRKRSGRFADQRVAEIFGNGIGYHIEPDGSDGDDRGRRECGTGGPISDPVHQNFRCRDADAADRDANLAGAEDEVVARDAGAGGLKVGAARYVP